MDPLIPAFVAVMLAGLTDRPPVLVALLADRFGVGSAMAGTFAAQAVGYGIAAGAGALVAPQLPADARTLLLALALMAAGGSALFAARLRDRLDGWRLPGPIVAALGVGILALGDRSQFLVFALSARTPSPILATTGATLAATALAFVAATLGERGWSRLPFTILRPIIGALLLGTSAATALTALRLA